MNKDDYDQTINHAFLLGRTAMEMEMEIDAALDAIGNAEALGPVLDPTSARAAGGRMVAIKRLLRALRDVREAYEEAIEAVEESEIECEALRKARGE